MKEAHEAKIKEYLTANFKSALKAASKGKELRREKNRSDKLLHPRLDKLVKEESKTNSKVAFGFCSFSGLIPFIFVKISNVVKARAGSSRGSSSRDYSRDNKDRATFNYNKRRKEGSGKGHNPKKRFKRNKERTDKSDSRSGRKEDKSGEKGEQSSSLAAPAQPSFRKAWFMGVFSVLALSMISKAGLCLNTAVEVTCKPIAGRIASCYNNWITITSNSWILDIVKQG